MASTINNITPKIKVHLIISTRTGDKTIEKIFIHKQNAQKYVDTYKESHNYYIEDMELSE